MYQRGKAFLGVKVPPKTLDSDDGRLSPVKARAGLGLSLSAPLPFTQTALAGARPPFTVGLVTFAWLLANAVLLRFTQ
ncbi:hypothetical protein O165_010845 [Pseudomonas soli]|nr:hypothetical protein O165_010845 [Pseudomonas soli]